MRERDISSFLSNRSSSYFLQLMMFDEGFIFLAFSTLLILFSIFPKIIPNFQSIFIWILATSSLILVISSPSSNTSIQSSSYDRITTKHLLDNISPTFSEYDLKSASDHFSSRFVARDFLMNQMYFSNFLEQKQ